ncbi:Short-chain dehydrogenase TIC 32 chloroplastic [Bienertia sinuspersici]
MWIFGRKNSSGLFSGSSTAEEVTNGIDGTGLTAIVTGASSGIGAETARTLALRGVYVIMADKDMVSGTKIRTKILEEIPRAKVDIMELDLSSMVSVRKFASKYNTLNHPLNILINNAGVFGIPFALSQDNIEQQFAINYLDTMKNTVSESGIQGRIVNVSSEGHRLTYNEGIRFDKLNDPSGYSRFYSYGQSKLAIILYANELSNQLKDEGIEITVNSVHPGCIQTNIFQTNSLIMHGIRYLVVVHEYLNFGASTTCYVALHPQVKGISGEYFSDCKIANPSKQAQDITLGQKLWDFSMNLVK